MLIAIPDVLPREVALALRERIAAADWVDGNATSGSGAASVKRNRQLPEESETTRAAQEEVTLRMDAPLGGTSPFRLGSSAVSPIPLHVRSSVLGPATHREERTATLIRVSFVTDECSKARRSCAGNAI